MNKLPTPSKRFLDTIFIRKDDKPKMVSMLKAAKQLLLTPNPIRREFYICLALEKVWRIEDYSDDLVKPYLRLRKLISWRLGRHHSYAGWLKYKDTGEPYDEMIQRGRLQWIDELIEELSA